MKRHVVLSESSSSKENRSTSSFRVVFVQREGLLSVRVSEADIEAQTSILFRKEAAFPKDQARRDERTRLYHIKKKLFFSLPLTRPLCSHSLFYRRWRVCACVFWRRLTRTTDIQCRIRRPLHLNLGKCGRFAKSSHYCRCSTEFITPVDMTP